MEDLRRYDIRWANLDPTQGAEMAKTRPVVIVSRNELNRVLKTVTVCPLTSQLHPTWRTRLCVSAAGRDSEIAADQIRTVSATRLGDKIDQLDDESAAALRRLLTQMYGE